TQGMERGLNPNTVALDIVGRIPPGSNTRQGGLIGLDSTKLAWVQNAREELESGDPARMAAYLQRERRDRNLDGIVERAIAAERPPTRAEIQRLTARYSDRLLKLRGDTIGRTEAMQALNAGQFQAYAQAVKAGRLPADAITKRWKTAADGDRVRDSHRDLHNDEIPFTEDFRTRYGSTMAHPGDTSKGARKRDIINCRCICEYRVDFIKARLGAKVREEPTDRTPPPVARPTLAQALRDINKRARKSVMDNGRRTGVEHLLFVDARTGKSPTKGTRGIVNEVHFTPDMLRLADDPTQKIIVHHNHPSSSSLSYADLWQIQNRPGLYEIYAHGHNGNEFRAREISRRLTQEVHNLVKERTRLVVQSRISALGRSGDVDKARRLYDRATILHSHGINLAYGRNGLMRYRARFAKDTRDTLNEFADMMDDVAKAADDALRELLGEL
ncbi:MAG: phage minor head protein, partial [Pseudomonadota bacterium]|nr:phage minor head protein [Pseudomonadota bacterium]